MKNNAKASPIFLSFLVMGFGDAVGPLTSQLQETFSLSNFSASLVTFMGFIMFGLLSIPLSIYQDRKGKKYVLLLGLIAAFLGLLLPILGNYSSFILLLTSLLLLGTGATFLQVAGNPIMRDVSPKGKYARNLSFGQFVKAIGSLSTALLPIIAVSYWQLDWRIIFPIYAPIVFITLLYLYLTTIKEEKNEKEKAASLSSCLSLLKDSRITLMVLGIFLYVGAEVTMSARLPNYLAHQFSFDIKTLGLWGTLFFFLALMTGRFLGGIILNWLSPSKFLLITAVISLVGITVLFITPNQLISFVAIAFIGLGFANIFPLIFSMTVDQFPERSNEISGLMVTAIIGGAIIPVFFGIIADLFSQITGFLIPMLCVIYIVVLAFNKNKVSHEQS